MNKQELINSVKAWGSWLVEDGEKDSYVKISKVRELINQLDEPSKVKIPPFVAEYLELTKKEEFSFDAVFVHVKKCPKEYGFGKEKIRKHF